MLFYFHHLNYTNEYNIVKQNFTVYLFCLLIKVIRFFFGFKTEDLFTKPFQTELITVFIYL